MTMKNKIKLNKRGHFPERAARLDDIADTLDLSQDFPLLKSAALDPTRFARLRDAVGAYLVETLNQFDPAIGAVNEGDVLSAYAADILRLPNITPNGLVLPKRTTCTAYGAVHAAVSDVFATAGLDKKASGIHAPVNIRLVQGRPDPRVDARPRASTKYHSDVWAGEPAGAIMVFLPVFGDTKNIGVDWIEPREFPEDLLGPLDDFLLGRDLIKNGTPYRKAGFTNGDILLADPFLVHATKKTKPGLRLSIDFRFIAATSVPSDAPAPGTREDNYLSFDAWSEIGLGMDIDTDAELQPFTGSDETLRNEYAQPYRIVPTAKARAA